MCTQQKPAAKKLSNLSTIFLFISLDYYQWCFQLKMSCLVVDNGSLCKSNGSSSFIHNFPPFEDSFEKSSGRAPHTHTHAISHANNNWRLLLLCIDVPCAHIIHHIYLDRAFSADTSNVSPGSNPCLPFFTFNYIGNIEPYQIDKLTQKENHIQITMHANQPHIHRHKYTLISMCTLHTRV